MSAQITGMLTAISWIPTGAMKQIPIRLGKRPEPVEGEEDSEEDEGNWVDVDDEEDAAPGTASGNNKRAAAGGNKKKERSDKYEEDDSKKNPGNVFGQGQNVLDEIGSDDEDEAEDTVIRDTDLVLCTSRANEETPSLELYVYDEEHDHLYLHHDMPVSAFPLTTCWFSDGKSSLCLVGTMHPFAEVWNLDVLDAVEPIGVLGGCTDPLDNYKRKVRRSTLQPGSHTDAVLSIDWNTSHQTMCLTGSADQTCKLWDLATTECIHTAPLSDKVQCVKWSTQNPSQLLTGTFDGTITLFDSRNSEDAAQLKLDSGIEKAQFCYQSNRLFASTSSGHFGAYDLRQLNQPLFVVKTNNENTCFGINRHKPNFCAAGGKDGLISLWDLNKMVSEDQNAKINQGGAMPQGKATGATSKQPECIIQHKLGVGEVFSMDFHPNKPYYLTACGAAGKPLVYDTQLETEGRFEK